VGIYISKYEPSYCFPSLKEAGKMGGKGLKDSNKDTLPREGLPLNLPSKAMFLGHHPLGRQNPIHLSIHPSTVL
jgi:hypothetical protein